MANPYQSTSETRSQPDKADIYAGLRVAVDSTQGSQQKSDSQGNKEDNRILELVGKALSLWSQQYLTPASASAPVEKPAAEKTASHVYDVVIGALQALGTASPRQIAQATGQSVQTVQRHLRALVEEGTVTKYGNTRSVRYQLTTPN